MPGVVAILEDTPGRLTEMRACLREMLPHHQHLFFDNSSEMIAWLAAHLSEVVFISLDHDLPIRQERAGRRIDAGTGRLVADFLATMPPTCPVIVHCSSDDFAQGMLRVLKDAGWPTSRVRPMDDHAWIQSTWAAQVQKYRSGGWIFG